MSNQLKKRLEKLTIQQLFDIMPNSVYEEAWRLSKDSEGLLYTINVDCQLDVSREEIKDVLIDFLLELVDISNNKTARYKSVFFVVENVDGYSFGFEKDVKMYPWIKISQSSPIEEYLNKLGL